METLKCPKCRHDMVFCNGYASGPYGPDIENCRDPYHKCKNCSYEIDCSEPEPESHKRNNEIDLPFKVDVFIDENLENKLIEVCDNCLTASCWYGEGMCDEAKYAGTVSRTVSELKSLNNEHASYWSDEKMKEMFGGVAPYGYKK